MLRKIIPILVLLFATCAYAESFCYYIDEQAGIKQVKDLAAVPAKYKKSARCIEGKKNAQESTANVEIAKPSDVQLEGNIRHEQSSTPVGRVDLRWPRSVELLFGRTPQRALAEASRAVSRALKKGGFPTELASLSLDWDVIFFDKDIPSNQIPLSLITGCHPGWMLPPADIYVAADALVSGCSGNKKEQRAADEDLARVLIHEMGHAVENQLLGGNMGMDRMRAEGFASWFEQYGSDFAPIIPRGSTREMYWSLARRARAQSGSNFMVFSGTAQDYAQASMYFSVISERFGVRGVMDLYKIMREEGVDLGTAIEKRFNWNAKKISQEIDRLLN